MKEIILDISGISRDSASMIAMLENLIEISQMITAVRADILI